LEKYKRFFTRFLADESGPTLLEYVALAVLLILVVWGAVQALSGDVNSAFRDISTKFRTR